MNQSYQLSESESEQMIFFVIMILLLKNILDFMERFFFDLHFFHWAERFNSIYKIISFLNIFFSLNCKKYDVI